MLDESPTSGTALHTDGKALKERGDRLFEAKRSWDSLNQEIALNFNPIRADFTSVRSDGEEFADHLVSGYPLQVARNLTDSIGSMLRPRNLSWFHGGVDDEDDHETKLWLEWATGKMRKAMYDRRAMFTRATKEADGDYACFGNAAISTEVNRRTMTLIYRSWHLRDVAWAEDAFGQICETHLNWKPTCAQLCEYFPETVHPNVKKRVIEKDGQKPMLVRRVVIRADIYDATRRFRQPWVDLFVDCENNHIMQEAGSWTPVFTIPRWVTRPGSQYAYSPAAICALPDARLIQAMTLTLLDAGERAANPPLIGVASAIRGDIQAFPGGFTAIDAEYDERLGEVLRPLAVESRALPFGIEMNDRTQQAIAQAFYLNKLSLPPREVSGEMTAFEVGQRVQEYIRQALPLFEPIESEYNGGLCDITFETMLRMGGFGPWSSIPPALSGREVQWKFESPLAEMIERHKGQTFLEAKAYVAEATALDPTAAFVIDAKATLRDVLSGIGSPEKWIRSEEDVQRDMQAQAEQQQMASTLAAMEQASKAAANLGQAAQSLPAPVAF